MKENQYVHHLRKEKLRLLSSLGLFFLFKNSSLYLTAIDSLMLHVTH